MRLEHYSTAKLKEEILAIVAKHLDISKHRLFFFGSRTMGKGNDRSDIDIGIEGENAVPTLALAEIEDEIESIPTLYKIDFVDFKRVSANFRQVALQFSESF